MSNQNEVLDCIQKRRSTRRFKNEQITQEQLTALLDAAVWAPSGTNNQSWLFTAIQKPDVLSRLNELVCEAFANWESDDNYPGKIAAKERAAKKGYHFFYQAPTLILATNQPHYENAMADCACAVQNILLAATSLGLGSCYINQLFWLNEDVVLRSYLAELGIPKEHVICNSVAIGYAAGKSITPARKEGTIHIIS
jgi:nitroreductase